jgi:AraC-like DNA-binding protein
MTRKPWQENDPLDPEFPFFIRDSTAENYIFQTHWHTHYEMVQVLGGTIEAVLENKTYKTRRGDILLIDAEVGHGFFNPANAKIRVFHFDLAIFEKDSGAIIEDIENNPSFFSRCPVLRVGSVHAGVETLLAQTYEEFFCRSPGYRRMIRAKLNELAVFFMRGCILSQTTPKLPGSQDAQEPPESENLREPTEIAPSLMGPSKLARPADTGTPIENGDTQSSRARIDTILSFIYRNYDNPKLTIEQTAAAVGLSKYYFARFFKIRMGITFHNYLTVLRVTLAKKYLLTTDRSVTDIAWRCGFSNLTTFDRLFKARTGIPPSRYLTASIKRLPDSAR